MTKFRFLRENETSKLYSNTVWSVPDIFKVSFDPLNETNDTFSFGQRVILFREQKSFAGQNQTYWAIPFSRQRRYRESSDSPIRRRAPQMAKVLKKKIYQLAQANLETDGSYRWRTFRYYDKGRLFGCANKKGEIKNFKFKFKLINPFGSFSLKIRKITSDKTLWLGSFMNNKCAWDLL